MSADRDGPLLHPLHGLLVSFAVALFPSAAITDLAYLQTAHIQWSNFSSWLIAGGLLMSGLALLWAVVGVIAARRTGRGKRLLVFLLLLGAAWVVGFFNALIHGRDAWASVTATGLLLSIVAAILALAAGWLGFSASPRTERT